MSPSIQHSPQDAQLLLCEARGGGLPGEDATRLGERLPDKGPVYGGSGLLLPMGSNIDI